MYSTKPTRRMGPIMGDYDEAIVQKIADGPTEIRPYIKTKNGVVSFNIFKRTVQIKGFVKEGQYEEWKKVKSKKRRKKKQRRTKKRGQ
jgi:hypothetical protein